MCKKALNKLVLVNLLLIQDSCTRYLSTCDSYKTCIWYSACGRCLFIYSLYVYNCIKILLCMCGRPSEFDTANLSKSLS